jgi:hypothetical protein
VRIRTHGFGLTGRPALASALTGRRCPLPDLARAALPRLIRPSLLPLSVSSFFPLPVHVCPQCETDRGGLHWNGYTTLPLLWGWYGARGPLGEKAPGGCSGAVARRPKRESTIPLPLLSCRKRGAKPPVPTGGPYSLVGQVLSELNVFRGSTTCIGTWLPRRAGRPPSNPFCPQTTPFGPPPPAPSSPPGYPQSPQTGRGFARAPDAYFARRASGRLIRLRSGANR